MPRGKPEPWDAETFARAAGLKRAGFTTKQIAEKLGVSVSAVKNRMYRSGVHSRLDGRWGRFVSGFQYGPLSGQVLNKLDRVDEFLGSPEGDEQ
jgi:hypothetical protein